MPPSPPTSSSSTIPQIVKEISYRNFLIHGENFITSGYESHLLQERKREREREISFIP
jgi:hypothetical protein